MPKYAIELLIDDKPTTFETEFEAKSSILRVFWDAIVFMRQQLSHGVMTNGATVIGSIAAVMASATPSAVILCYGMSIPATPGVVYDVTRDKIYLRRDGKSTLVKPEVFLATMRSLASKDFEAEVSRATSEGA